ncbi:hypothetical protein E2562_035265 [Oryza meyeriana var. granulata]|uniref:DUF834 domain-containing protein n=1 Tax=Oryza meyeriana var. granulata TaxID=110450 RepID=A0A6G1F1M0_9ORYZ|nr:hypothetical protein E2562_035265 [Oryza meyeriana var. granulata]
MASMVDKDGRRGALISKTPVSTGEAASRRRAVGLGRATALRGGGRRAMGDAGAGCRAMGEAGVGRRVPRDGGTSAEDSACGRAATGS